MSGDRFYQSMTAAATESLKRCCDEVDRLRAENRALRATIDAFPSHATELQDRVTMLETFIRERADKEVA